MNDKKIIYLVAILIFMGLSSVAFADGYRVVVRDENGLNICERGPGYETCKTANLRHTSIIGGETMSCVFEGSAEVDCLPYEDHYSMEWVMNHRNDEPDTPEVTSHNENTSASQNYSDSSSYVYYQEPTYWENDYAIPNGFTWGISVGWYGQVDDSGLAENSFSFGGDLGGKWSHFGFSIDCDLSISILDQPEQDIWTYSFHGLFMTFLPFDYGKEFTLGLGIGYTGWSLNYNREDKLNYHWYNDAYYSDNSNVDKIIGRGDFLSFKLNARLDFVFDDINIGFAFNWIPWLDVKHGGKIVNHIVGLQFRFGGIK